MGYFCVKKAGHAGTLDPLASGILPIALGEATKTTSFLMNQSKAYDFTMAFGYQTNSDDKEGDIIASSDHRPSNEEITAILPDFLGKIEQTPPIFSAIKQKGRPSYQRARAGEQFSLPPRKVQINDIRFLARPTQDCASFHVSCEKGVYVRALARDLALALGTRGHITALRRVRSGIFDESDIINLDKLQKIGHSPCELKPLLKPLEEVLCNLDQISLTPSEMGLLKQGQAITLASDRGASDKLSFDRGEYRDGSQKAQTLTLAVSQGVAGALAQRVENRLIPQRIFHL